MRDLVVHAVRVAASTPRCSLCRERRPTASAGAAGPAGNRYGDAAGHACVAVAGRNERVLTVRTGTNERVANMHAFAAAALQLFAGAFA